MRESTCRYEFGPFRLDPDEHLLLRDGAEVPVTPKVFDLLLALVRRHGRVVVKDELMKQVWPDRVIEEGNVTQSVVMLRKALGDSARAPRYVETRPKRGYRFIADVRESGGAPPARPARRAVGRARECAALRAALDVAAGGTGQLLCITGEPGMGKTTLVECFIAEQAAQERAIVVSRGRCSERLAGTAAYLPWLDALESVLQVDGGDSIASSMRKLAPSWYAWVTAPQGETRSGADVRANSQALMMRELRAFLLQASRRRPVVVFLDDLQWADVSTVDLLAYLATGFEGMRVLFVVAYRPCEALLARQPFLQVKRELEARGIGHELALEFLSAADIEEYLAAEFPDHRFPAGFAALIHSRTEGNPLFVVDLVAYLRTRGVIAADATGSWQLADPTANIQPEWPASILSLIQRKFDQLDGASRQLLAAASVQGYQFDSAVIARALGMDPAAVEARLDELERVHGLVRLLGEDELAGGTLTLRGQFVHVLHQNAFHASLGPSRRARLSAAVARALEHCRGDRDAAIASELAHLYEGAQEFARATEAYCHAAERAGALFGHAEAALLARRGLALLDKLPETPERAQRELRLHVALGVALSITTGYAAAETGSSLARAYELCGRTEDTPQLFPAIWRLWIHRAAGAESRAARALGEKLVRMARRTRDPIHLVGAHFALGNTLHLRGDLVSGSAHLERAVALHRAGSCPAVTALYSGDPGLYSWSHSARAVAAGVPGTRTPPESGGAGAGPRRGGPAECRPRVDVLRHLSPTSAPAARSPGRRRGVHPAV